jgi:putative thiazole-containing bacteriocin maturation protein
MWSNVDSVNPSMCLKVKMDTFYLPDLDGSVYFRNNEGSFKMEGKSVFQWVERLLPALNGQQSLFDLTDGLPELHKKRVYEIASALFQNGFARDVSSDRPHQLSKLVQSRYKAQIEFLDSLAGSGAFRFQKYRGAKVLAIGAGPFLVSLVYSLLESGIPVVTILNLDSESVNREQIQEMVRQKHQTDASVELHELVLRDGNVRLLFKTINSFDAILYASKNENINELLLFQSICRQNKKLFIPAIFYKDTGIAGPVIHPDAKVGYESMWQRIHATAFDTAKIGVPSPIAVSMLANLIVFELFKTIAGEIDLESSHQFYLLNPYTLEGAWHPFLPHPVDQGLRQATTVDVQSLLQSGRKEAGINELLMYFGQLTDIHSGIFHVFAEEDLLQLPLAQCRVQVVNPMTKGPAELLPEVVCQGLTHEDARCEAGYTGMEDYVRQLVPEITGTIVQTGEFVGIGTGATIPEAIWRGIYQCLMHELKNRQCVGVSMVNPVQISSIEDEICAFYLRVLTASGGSPVFGICPPVLGFPVVFTAVNGKSGYGTGLNITMALRAALEQIIVTANRNSAAESTTDIANGSAIDSTNDSIIEAAIPNRTAPKLTISTFKFVEEPADMANIPAEGSIRSQDILSAIEILEQSGQKLIVLDLAVEPFLTDVIAGVFGVLLRQGESQ